MTFTEKEQLGLLKRGLERRLVGATPSIEMKKKEIARIDKVRAEYVERLEKYKDDEVVVSLLTSQLKEYDRQYSGTKQIYLNTIEEVIESKPNTKELLRYVKLIEAGKRNGDVLHLLLDLFFKATLTDWNAMEESAKRELLKEKA